MTTIEDLYKYEKTHKELENMCYAFWYENVFTGYEEYNGFELWEEGKVRIHYRFINYLDEPDGNELIVTFGELCNFINNSI